MIKVLAMQIVSHKRRVDFPASLVMKCRKVTKHYLVACKQTFALAATVNFPYGTITAHTLLHFFSFTKPGLQNTSRVVLDSEDNGYSLEIAMNQKKAESLSICEIDLPDKTCRFSMDIKTFHNTLHVVFPELAKHSPISELLHFLFLPPNSPLWFGPLVICSYSDILSLGSFLPTHSVQFSCSAVSGSLQFHGPQHTRLPCPSPTVGVYSNSCPLSW